MVRRPPARPSQLPVWYSSGVTAGPTLCRVDPLHLEGSRGGNSAYHTSLGGQSVGRHPLVTCFLHSMRKLYALKWKYHFMVRRLPARPSQLPVWCSSGVRAGLFLHGVNPLHLEGCVTAIQPTTPLLVSNQWAITPWVHISSTAVCMVGEPPLKTRKLYALKCSTSWCGGRQLDPANCPFVTVLEFVQVRSSAGLTTPPWRPTWRLYRPTAPLSVAYLWVDTP